MAGHFLIARFAKKFPFKKSDFLNWLAFSSDPLKLLFSLVYR